jgi:hypothetical protein
MATKKKTKMILQHKEHYLYGKEFEEFMSKLHPHKYVEWYSCWDCGYYTDDWVQGAWMAWLTLTGKRDINLPE